jgi:hypothetical protein
MGYVTSEWLYFSSENMTASLCSELILNQTRASTINVQLKGFGILYTATSGLPHSSHRIIDEVNSWDGTYSIEGPVLLYGFKNKSTALVTGDGTDIRLYTWNEMSHRALWRHAVGSSISKSSGMFCRINI